MPRYIPPALRGKIPSGETSIQESSNETSGDLNIANQARRLSDLELTPTYEQRQQNNFGGRNRGRGHGYHANGGRGNASFNQDGSQTNNFYHRQNTGARKGLHTLEDIHQHFWPTGSPGPRSTLNDAEEKPGQLAYVILFKDANPRWATDRILFAKTNIDCLPREAARSDTTPPGYRSAEGNSGNADVNAHDYRTSNHNSAEDVERSESQASANQPADHEQSASSNAAASPAKPDRHTAHDVRLEEPQPVISTDPVAVFAQTFNDQSGRSFRFVAWFHLSKVDFLAPRSEALVRMLHQKWDKRNSWGQIHAQARHEAAWQESLGVKWAVVKMVEGNTGRAKPAVAVFEEAEKTVDQRCRSSAEEADAGAYYEKEGDEIQGLGDERSVSNPGNVDEQGQYRCTNGKPNKENYRPDAPAEGHILLEEDKDHNMPHSSPRTVDVNK